MRFLVLIATLFVASPMWAQNLRTITVSGEGRVQTVPDMAVVTLGAQARAETAAEAMDQTSQIVGAIISRLAEMGVESRDIQTSGVNLNAITRYDRDREVEVQLGYAAQNMLTIRVRDLAGLGDLLGAVLDDGANSLRGLHFDVQDPQPLMDEARQGAVRDAIRKAGLYAQAAEVSVGRVLSIRDTAAPETRPLAMDAPMLEAAAARSVPIASGEMATTASVVVVLEIAD